MGSSSVRINTPSVKNSTNNTGVWMESMDVSEHLSCSPAKISDLPSQWGVDTASLLDLSNSMDHPPPAVLDGDSSPVNSDSAAPAMPPRMLLLGNRQYASSTHWSPQKPPLEQQWRRWDPPLLGDLPDDFLRITLKTSAVSQHPSNVHSDFYGAEHVNKSQLAGTRLVLNSEDVTHQQPRSVIISYVTRHSYKSNLPDLFF